MMKNPVISFYRIFRDASGLRGKTLIYFLEVKKGPFEASKKFILKLYLYNVGPMSSTLAQHYINSRS